MNKVEIPLSRKKLLLGIGGSLLFVASGVFFLFSTDTFSSRHDPVFVKAAGIASIIFFGATGFIGAKKLLTRTSGLVIDDDGITDRSHASSVGLIKWEDILKVSTGKVSSSSFLLIFVKNPSQYLDNAKGIKRKLLKANHNMYGTPLSIVSSTLNSNFQELEKLIKDHLKEQQKKLGTFQDASTSGH